MVVIVSHDNSSTSDSVTAEAGLESGLNLTILVLTDRELVCPKASRFLLSKNRFRTLGLQALLP